MNNALLTFFLPFIGFTRVRSLVVFCGDRYGLTSASKFGWTVPHSPLVAPFIFCCESKQQKGRFQLFGDTMNMASRMETTGVVHQIQCSAETAALLPAHWLRQRQDCVHAKGKGTLRTYFVTVSSGRDNETSVMTHVGSNDKDDDMEQLNKTLSQRLLKNSSPRSGDSLQR